MATAATGNHKERYMATESQAARNRLIKDFKSLVHDADELIKVTAGQTGDKIDSVRARAEESLREAKRKIEEIETDFLGQTKAAVKATDELVHKNPWQAVGVATAVGFLLGMLTSRR